MSNEEFNNASFSSKTEVVYKDGTEYNVGAVDFDEGLIGLYTKPLTDEDEFRWVRYENVTLKLN